MKIIKRTKCQVCNVELPMPSLDLGNHPMCDDLKKIGSTEACEEYPIQISLCRQCLTAHNLYNIKKEFLFPKNYHFRPRFTIDVLKGMEDLVNECELDLGNLNNKIVCDVGCNDGSLLNFFKIKGCITTGIEPTDAALDAKNSHNIIQDYFNETSVNSFLEKYGRPDIVTFTNVFAHTEELKETLICLKKMMKSTTYLIVENHYLGTIVKTNQFDTFYHEHPRTYSKKSFDEIAKNLNLDICKIQFPQRYGGNIRVFLGKKEELKLNIDHKKTQDYIKSINEDFIEEYFEKIQKFVDNWKGTTKVAIKKLVNQGFKIYGKSFPGRAAILIKLLNINENIMPAVFEKDKSEKIDHYVPSTKIKIISDTNWIENKMIPESMIIWGWHIPNEIKKYLRDNGYKGKIYVPLPEFMELK